jgi:hypothetical protein
MFCSVLTWLPPGVELVRDVTPADWVIQRLKPWDLDGVRVESFAPDCFEAYARVFHPAGSRPVNRGVIDKSAGTRWGDLARARGVALTPDIGFLEVAGVEQEDDPVMDELAPMEGDLPVQTCDALVGALRGHTATPDQGWFCLWEGNGSFWSQSHGPLLPRETSGEETERYRREAREQDRLLASTPRVEAYARSYFLFRGPLAAACSFEPGGWYTSPNLFWPDDRAWIVVTEVDGYSTYVGATSAAVDDVVAAPGIEAIRVTLDTHTDPGPFRPQWR